MDVIHKADLLVSLADEHACSSSMQREIELRESSQAISDDDIIKVKSYALAARVDGTYNRNIQSMTKSGNTFSVINPLGFTLSHGCNVDRI